MNTQAQALTMCIDGAVLKKVKDKIEVLLIRKANEIHWRFPGGRLESTDKTLEAGANREVGEETGVDVGKATYIASEGGVVSSALYAFPYLSGTAIGGDDAVEARWFVLDNLVWNDMESCHQSFLSQLKMWVHIDLKNTFFFGG
jgi:ADP-ribose pyrophosphatase YjhB (NUDIX family)